MHCDHVGINIGMLGSFLKGQPSDLIRWQGFGN
jgi:hypothetical protein